MASYFEDLKETIEEASSSDAPIEARLVLFGRVLDAWMREAISYEEQKELRKLLVLPPDALRYESFALTGNEEEYRDLLQDGALPETT